MLLVTPWKVSLYSGFDEPPIGMNPGGTNHFAAVYKAFGDMVMKQYPELLSGYPPAAEILDTSYLAALQAKAAKP